MTQSTQGRTVDRPSLLASTRVPPAAFEATIQQFYESVGSPLALGLWMCYKSGDHRQIADHEINPHHYIDRVKFRDDLCATSFLRKASFLKTGYDLKERALASFGASEALCAATNDRFRDLASDPSYNGSVVPTFHLMVRKIARILGDVVQTDGDGNSRLDPSFVEELFDGGAFGPGVSLLVKGDDTSSTRKFREENQITPALYRLIEPVMEHYLPMWHRDGKLRNCEFVGSSEVMTVPKNAKTDRTICIEPGLNIWFQKSLGRMIRRRLRKNGLELNSSCKNEAGARDGSKDSSLCTVDFSAASDTISRLMVREVLPPVWHSVLDIARSRRYRHCGSKTEHTFHKFSSMGNGFTFELETLIFYAAALAVCEQLGVDDRAVSVFGDDVILPTQCFALYHELCNFLGFRINTTKTFSTSSFRESCGSYWFDGADVKPLFLKEKLSRASEVFTFANAVSSLAHRRCYGVGRDSLFLDLHTSLVSLIPKPIRLHGERSGGDGCIQSNFDECRPRVARLDERTMGWEGYTFLSFVQTPITIETDSPALLSARLTGNAERAYLNSVSLRAKTRTLVKRVLVPQWYNFGPWISGS